MMSATLATHECTSKPGLDEEALIKQLTDLIKSKVSYSKRLDVLGILSFTTDNEKEKFLKIDISFDAIKEQLPLSDCNVEENLREITTSSVKEPLSTEVTDDDLQKNKINLPQSRINRCDQSPSSSPPLLPPLYIQHGRISRHEDKVDISDDSRETTNGCIQDETNTTDDSTLLSSCRRDRRKCRNPKRQIVDSNCRSNINETPGVTSDLEDTNKNSSSTEINHSAKMPRLEDDSNPASDITEVNVDSKLVSNANTILPTQNTVIGKPVTTLNTAGQAATNVSFLPLPYATIGTCFTPSITSVDLSTATNQLAAGTKYTISAKSLGLGDIGELCGILPLNALLGKSVGESAVSSKVLFTNCAPSSSVSVSSSESYNQTPIPNQLTSCVSANSAPNQSFLLNPNLAAAVAAAISNSSLQSPCNSSTITGGTTQISSSIPTLSTPTIALTGPSGELIGTIPIGNSASHGILTSALGNNTLTLPTSLNSALTSVNVALPGGVNTSSPSCLASTLNWLRCATAPDSSAPPLLSNLTVNGTNPSLSLNSNNPVALLHSLVTQQQQQQQQQHIFQQPTQPTLNKQQPLSSFSVGPTLALIGTLGLNSPMASTTVVSASSTEPASYTVSGSLNSNPSVIATSINNTITGVQNNNPANNNGAAMVAAALLRSLANVKQINQEQTESGSLDSNNYTLPSSLTLITSNVPQPGQQLSSATGNPLKSDDQSNLISSMINKPGINSFSLSTVPVSNAAGLVSSLRNAGAPLGTCVSTPTTRNSIMLSCPRGSSEMNLLLTSASAHAFGSSGLASLTAAPTALSFQSLNSHPGSVALASPVLLQAPVTSSLGAVTTVVSATATVTSAPPISTLSSDQTLVSKGERVSNITSAENTLKSITTDPNVKNAPVSDPTASAIDRILQTIKGCMSSSANRDQESKSKSNNRKSELTTITFTSSSQDGEIRPNNDIKPSSLKIVPGNAKYSTNPESEDNTVTESEGNINPANDRLILPSIHKGISDSNENNTIPVSKVYRCRYCGKTFNRKFCRERHERLHTGVKPYTCEICDEKFIRLEDKKRHVRSLQHYLAGRCCSFQSEGDQNEELVAMEVEPSSVLPLLAHTLQNGANAESDIAYQEIEEATIGNSDINISDPLSDNGSDACVEAQEADSSDLTADDVILKDEIKELTDTTVNISSQSHEDCDSVKKEVTLGVISSLKLAAGNQTFNQRTKNRIVLRETQQDANSSAESKCEILTKLPTVLLVNAEDILHVKTNTD